MLPPNLKPFAHIIAGADDTLHHPTRRTAAKDRVPARVDIVRAVYNPDPSAVHLRQGNPPVNGLPDMELWCNCDD
ncbi:hypothetical protein [Candidatus Contendibacter odensensis]|uniref:Uncharacterized protein n=1 Tax=Candidatus Contendobacter odensis Run_B_J11 TaxID=1400861 RepID=A0A7U7GEK6_9GAMM|nr:hypothetical protein [Candidatus Contendobacter odensis]CDH46945.1 hypothetical protein BN874_670008 [Candidatus Contendobacter odensis Run_B_J11]